MLDRIAARVDRAGHTVEQLLTLARLDPEAPFTLHALDLRALLVEAVAETAHLAAERDLVLALAEGDPVMVEGNEEALAIMLRNLLTNAFRYALAGSTVGIELSTGDPVALSICNDCRPLSAREFERVGERFYRVPGSAGVGAGLGLSIVRRIAEGHGARFSAGPSRDGGGFCARVSFPPGGRERPR